MSNNDHLIIPDSKSRVVGFSLAVELNEENLFGNLHRHILKDGYLRVQIEFDANIGFGGQFFPNQMWQFLIAVQNNLLLPNVKIGGVPLITIHKHQKITKLRINEGLEGGEFAIWFVVVFDEEIKSHPIIYKYPLHRYLVI